MAADTNGAPRQTNEVDEARDALILKMAGQRPMSHDELKAKLAAERPKKGREPKPAPRRRDEDA